MNIYELSRKFVNFSFENPSKVKPNHYALYYFAIEHCNRLGWKYEFGLPTTMAMEAIGIKSYNTYSNTFNELIDFGFFNLIQRSSNQYSANIIGLSNFNKPLDESLDKAFIKHATKQSESTGESIDSIIKQINNKQYNKKQLTKLSDCILNFLDEVGDKVILEYFNSFWDLYPNKIAKDKCKEKFLKLPQNDIEKILETIKDFVAYKPFKDYTHPNPLTYLNQKRWNDELKQEGKTHIVQALKYGTYDR